MRADKSSQAQLKRLDKIIARIMEIPRGPLLTPGELTDKLTAEALARLGAVQQASERDEDVRPRWAANDNTAPPWKDKETTP